MTGAGRDRWSERLALICALVLGLVLVWLLARTFWLLVPRDDGLAGVPDQAVVTASDRPAISIAKWHLFGNALQRLRAQSNAPATTLDLSLRGTLAEADPHQGIAVIADAQGAERAWRVGEEISTGVSLHEVHADRVVLLHDGVQEVLNLSRDEQMGRVAPLPTDQRGGAPLRNSAPHPAPGAVTSFAPINLPQGSINWQRAMDKVGGNPAELAKNVRVDPVIDNGRIAGVRVSTVNGDAALLGRIGLRPSDIVTAVNGVPVDSVARGQQILESLRDANSVRVTVTRDGRPTEISVQLR
jgi:general secretion pathway protein C